MEHTTTVVEIPVDRHHTAFDTLDLIYDRTRTALKRAKEAGFKVDPRSITMQGPSEFQKGYRVEFQASLEEKEL